MFTGLETVFAAVREAAAMIFITGGARSGKSSLAERLAGERGGEVTYVATAEPVDAEMRGKIGRHRERRPRGWKTVEASRDLPAAVEQALAGGGTVLVDCLTVYLANLMLAADAGSEGAGSEESADRGEGAGSGGQLRETIEKEVERLAGVCRSGNGRVIVVSNEVGMGIVPGNPLGRVFRDVAGWANQRLAGAAEEVFLCVSGIPLKVK